MLGLILNVFVASSMLTIFMTPIAGVMLYYFLAIFNPFGIVHSYPWFSYAVLISVITPIAFLINQKPLKFEFGWGARLVVVFWLWTVVTTLTAVLPSLAFSIFSENAKIVFFFCIATLVVTSRDRVHILIWSYAASTMFFSIKGGFFAITSGGLVLGPVGSKIFDTNEFARAAGIVLPLIVFLSRQTANKYARLALTWGAVFTFFSVLGTGSRGGFAAIVITAFFLLMFTKNRIRTLMVLAVFGITIFFLTPQSVIDQRFSRIESTSGYESDGSFQGRVGAWMYAIDTAVAKPIWGAGYGAFTLYKPFGSDGIWLDAHSIYFETLGEHGFVGLILYLLIGLAAFFFCKRTHRRTKNIPELRWENQLSLYLMACIVFHFAGGITVSNTHSEIYFLILLLVGGLSSVMKSEEVRLALENGKKGLKKVRAAQTFPVSS